VTLTQLSLVASVVLDVIPLRAKLEHAALIDSATGDRSPLAALP
jgi:hypothetical protein